MGVVTITQFAFGDFVSSAHTFGYILTGHFKMNAACMCTGSFMCGKESFDFTQNRVEVTGLISTFGGNRVAMHRVTGPDDVTTFGFDAFQQRDQAIFNFAIAQCG